jgi:integrase
MGRRGLRRQRHPLAPRDGQPAEPRGVTFDVATRKALRTYRRRVDQREMARGRDLTSWHSQGVGLQGRAVQSSGLTQMLDRRSKLAGVVDTCHSFRRSLAVRWLRGGGSEANLMRAAGWSNASMVSRYTASVAWACGVCRDSVPRAATPS